jgi:hypothetical protein
MPPILARGARQNNPHPPFKPTRVFWYLNMKGRIEYLLAPTGGNVMSRASLLKLAPLGAALLFSLGWSGPAAVGPPWISLEIPANPLDPTTRDAALVIHAFHHATPAGVPLTATAEGLVNGERRSVELELGETSRGSVYAVTQQWPSEGYWVLAITGGAHSDVSLLVELGPDGGVTAERFYEWSVKQVAIRSARVRQGGIDSSEIDRMLQRMAQSAD